MHHRSIIIIIIATSLILPGCVSMDQLREAAEQAEVRLEQMEQLNKQATIALEAAREVAGSTDDERVHRALDLAERAAERASEVLPAAREAARTTAEALAAAETPWWRKALSVTMALLGGGAAIIQSVRAHRWSGLARHGLQLAEELKHSGSDLDAAVAIERAEQWQRDRGLQDKVDSVRKRRTHV